MQFQARQIQTTQGNARQDKAILGKTFSLKKILGNSRQGNFRQGNSMQFKSK